MTDKRKRIEMSTRDQIILIAGGVLLIIVVGTVSLLVYAAHVATVVALRWWAVCVTMAVIPACSISWAFGRQEARAHIAGVNQGVEVVSGATAGMVQALGDVASVKVQAAQQLRQGQPPAFSQAFILPGLQSALGQAQIMPPRIIDEEVRP